MCIITALEIELELVLELIELLELTELELVELLELSELELLEDELESYTNSGLLKS